MQSLLLRRSMLAAAAQASAWRGARPNLPPLAPAPSTLVVASAGWVQASRAPDPSALLQLPFTAAASAGGRGFAAGAALAPAAAATAASAPLFNGQQARPFATLALEEEEEEEEEGVPPALDKEKSALLFKIDRWEMEQELLVTGLDLQPEEGVGREAEAARAVIAETAQLLWSVVLANPVEGGSFFRLLVEWALTQSAWVSESKARGRAAFELPEAVRVLGTVAAPWLQDVMRGDRFAHVCFAADHRVDPAVPIMQRQPGGAGALDERQPSKFGRDDDEVRRLLCAGLGLPHYRACEIFPCDAKHAIGLGYEDESFAKKVEAKIQDFMQNELKLQHNVDVLFKDCTPRGGHSESANLHVVVIAVSARGARLPAVQREARAVKAAVYREFGEGARVTAKRYLAALSRLLGGASSLPLPSGSAPALGVSVAGY